MKYYKVSEGQLKMLIKDAIYYHFVVMDIDLDYQYEEEIQKTLAHHNVKSIDELVQVELDINDDYEEIKKGD